MFYSVKLQFFGGAAYTIQINDEKYLLEQIKEYLIVHTKERGDMVFIYQAVSSIKDNTKLLDLNFKDGDEIEAFILKADQDMVDHIKQCRMLVDGFIYCGDIAMSKQGKHIVSIK